MRRLRSFSRALAPLFAPLLAPLLISLTAPARSSAQEAESGAEEASPGSPTEIAETLIHEGVALRRQGRDEQALALFERAHELSPSPRAVAQIGMAEHALGRLVRAERHLLEATSGEATPWIERARPVLAAALEEIRGHLGDLRIDGGVEGAEVRVDGELVGALPAADADPSARSFRLPAGDAAVEVRAEGYHPFSRPVHVEAGAGAHLEVQLIAIGEEPIRYIEAPPDRTPQDVGLALTIAGGIMLAGALSSGMWWLDRQSEYDACFDDSLATECHIGPDDLIEPLENERNAAIGLTLALMGLGIASVSNGVMLLVLTGEDEDEDEDESEGGVEGEGSPRPGARTPVLSLAPVLAPGFAGISASGRFY